MTQKNKVENDLTNLNYYPPYIAGCISNLLHF